MVHGHIGFVETVHPQHAQKLAVRRRVGAQSHQGIGDRVIKLTRQAPKKITALPLDDTATGIDHGSLGSQQHPGRLLDLARVPTLGRRIGAHLDRLRIAVLELFVRPGDILGNIDNHRPRPARGGDVKRFPYYPRNIFRATNLITVFHDGSGYAHHVGLLERVLTDQVALHLSRKHNHRDRVHIGRRNAGDSVGGAGPGGYQHHAGLAGSASISIGRVGGRLLMSHQHVGYLAILEQSIVYV